MELAIEPLHHIGHNGEVERQNRTLLKAIKTAHASGKNCKRELNKFLLAYRSTPHSVTGVCPAEMLFNRKLRTKLPELNDSAIADSEVRDRDDDRKEEGKEYWDNKRKAQQCDLVPGDKVLMQNKKQNKLSTAYQDMMYDVVEKKENKVVITTDWGTTVAAGRRDKDSGYR